MTVRIQQDAAGEAAPHEFDCELHRDFESLASMAPEWDELVERCGADIFATFDWCRVWWRHFQEGRRLCLILVRESGALIGVFPLFAETLALGPVRLRAVRQVGCDRAPGGSSIVVEPDRLREATGCLSVWLMDQSEPWDVLQIGPLPGHHEGTGLLEGVLRHAFGEFASVETQGAGSNIFFELRGSEDECVASLSKNQRENLRKESRRLESRHRVEVRYPSEQSDVLKTFDRFVQLHEKQWRARNRLGHFGDWPGAQSCYREMAAVQAALGRAMLIEIDADDETLAVLFGFRFGGKACALLMGRTTDPKWDFAAPGRLVLWTAIRNAIASGARLLDTMQGDYEYERRMGARVAERTVINITRRGGANGLRMRVFQAMARVLDLVYYKLYFLRIAPYMGGRQKPLWNRWITTRLMGCR